MGYISGNVVEKVVSGGIGWSLCHNKEVLCLCMESTLFLYDLVSLRILKKIETRTDTGNRLKITLFNEKQENNEEKKYCDGRPKNTKCGEYSVHENNSGDILGIGNIDENNIIRRGEFMKDSDLIGVGYFNGVCDIINTQTGDLIDRLEGDESEIKSISFNECGRLAFSTRQGSIWVWLMNSEGEWEIEEIIEYSESDVKSVIWHENSLISVGYSNEIVIYNRWEDDVCGIKWEIENIFKMDSCIWDASIIEDSVSYMGAVTQSGILKIFKKDYENTSDWEVVKEQKISEYPIISMCNGIINSIKCFAMIINRRNLALYSVDGVLIKEYSVLTEYDEPVDIIFSEKSSSFIILSYQIHSQKKRAIIRSIKL
ncbi:cytosolic iron-sulfur protein assembly protein CIAO1 [Nematocida parisii]|nr:cytosolic iron-sulfur protein assembly protein CIAO1 [Nematocida parisii]